MPPRPRRRPVRPSATASATSGGRHRRRWTPPAATSIEFGKFHGHTLGDIAVFEPSYIDWVAGTVTRDPELVAAARVLQADLDARGVARRDPPDAGPPEPHRLTGPRTRDRPPDTRRAIVPLMMWSAATGAMSAAVPTFFRARRPKILLLGS